MQCDGDEDWNEIQETNAIGGKNINIKIKVVTNKNIFNAIFRFIILNHFQANKILLENDLR